MCVLTMSREGDFSGDAWTKKPGGAASKPCPVPRICPNWGLEISRAARRVSVAAHWQRLPKLDHDRYGSRRIPLCLFSEQDVAQHGRRTRTLSPRVIKIGDPVPKGGGVYKLGDPYIAAGKWFVPVNDQSYDQVGIASWYGDFFTGGGRRTAKSTT